VFLSFASDDRPLADAVQYYVEQAGYPVYRYDQDPQPGTYPRAKIKEAIRQCSVFLVLLTTRSRDRAIVREEIGMADALNKRIVPMVEKGLREEDLGILMATEPIRYDPSDPNRAFEECASYFMRLRAEDKTAATTAAVVAAAVLGLAFYFRGPHGGPASSTPTEAKHA
jgi:hypothetical protein